MSISVTVNIPEKKDGGQVEVESKFKREGVNGSKMPEICRQILETG